MITPVELSVRDYDEVCKVSAVARSRNYDV